MIPYRNVHESISAIRILQAWIRLLKQGCKHFFDIFTILRFMPDSMDHTCTQIYRLLQDFFLTLLLGGLILGLLVELVDIATLLDEVFQNVGFCF